MMVVIFEVHMAPLLMIEVFRDVFWATDCWQFEGSELIISTACP
jgi:hypothetical protein